jgi:sporulation protein YlmC with PRC-barrel domain
MRIRYHEIVGRPAVTASGKRLGHIVDLSATACEESLVVDAMLVGPASFLTRIGLKHSAGGRTPSPHRIPWTAVISAGRTVMVRDDWDRLASPPRRQP